MWLKSFLALDASKLTRCIQSGDSGDVSLLFSMLLPDTCLSKACLRFRVLLSTVSHPLVLLMMLTLVYSALFLVVLEQPGISSVLDIGLCFMLTVSIFR